MMPYKIVFSDRAVKEFKKLDKQQAIIINGWIEKNLEGCLNPRERGKNLVNQRGWRYKIGKYRLIVDINDDELTVLALDIGHRQSIYKKK